MVEEKLEEWVKKDILKAIEDWDTRTQLMNQEDFDSPKNYKAWLDDIRISKKINVGNLCWCYKRIGVQEDVINKVIADLKEGGLL